MRRREKRGEGVEESEEKINGEEMRREKERGKRREISEREEGKVEKQRRIIFVSSGQHAPVSALYLA